MISLPPEIDSPELTDEERAGLMVAHECFVLPGEGEWVIEPEEES